MASFHVTKDYLGFEGRRNKTHAALYTELMKRAIDGADVSVIIGHHLTFEISGNLETENEIPSADTLIFDHDLMKAVFGDRAVGIMMHLAAVPCEARDELLGKYMGKVDEGTSLEPVDEAA